MNSINFYIKSYKNVLIILSSIILGIFVGIYFKEKTVILTPLGDIFLNLIFTIVTPLIFFSVSSSISNIITLGSTKRTIFYSIFVFFMMSVVATIFMVVCMKLFYFVDIKNLVLQKNVAFNKVDIISNFASIFTSSDFSLLLSKNSILALIVFSCLFGLSVKMLDEKSDKVKSVLNIGASIMYKMINLLMYYAPIGLFACFASYFGKSANKDLLNPIFTTVVFFYVVSMIFILVLYSLYVYFSAGKEGLKSLKHLLIPTTVAFGTQSSLVALPSNIESAKNINIPKSVYSLSLPLGSIIHLDGTSISCVLKIIFLCSIFGIPMTGFDFYFSIFVFSIFVCLISVGIPSGGLILETSIVAFYNLPTEVLPMLILLNYIIDPMITVINSNGNIIGSMIIARLINGRGWIYKKEIEEVEDIEGFRIYK